MRVARDCYNNVQGWRRIKYYAVERECRYQYYVNIMLLLIIIYYNCTCDPIVSLWYIIEGPVALYILYNIYASAVLMDSISVVI